MNAEKKLIEESKNWPHQRPHGSAYYGNGESTIYSDWNTIHGWLRQNTIQIIKYLYRSGCFTNHVVLVTLKKIVKNIEKQLDKNNLPDI